LILLSQAAENDTSDHRLYGMYIKPDVPINQSIKYIISSGKILFMPPARWLCISNRRNAQVTREQNIWGVAKQYAGIIERVAKGDWLLMYTRQEIVDREVIPPAVTGIYKVISPVYLDESPVFVAPEASADEVFPHRINVEPIKIFHKPIPFKPLINDLSFIRNKQKWSGSLRAPMSVIPEDDYRKIYTSDEKWHDRSGLR